MAQKVENLLMGGIIGQGTLSSVDYGKFQSYSPAQLQSLMARQLDRTPGSYYDSLQKCLNGKLQQMNCPQDQYHSPLNQQQWLMAQHQNRQPSQSETGCTPAKKEEKKMGTSYVRDYFLKHRELLMGLGIFILLDYYIFDGAFREKIKRIVHSFLDRAENTLVEHRQ